MAKPKRAWAYVDSKGGKQGRYMGTSASQAAKKAFKQHRGAATKLAFSIVELERGYKHLPVFYQGARVKLDTPRVIARKGKDGKETEYKVHYENRVKKVKKVPDASAGDDE